MRKAAVWWLITTSVTIPDHDSCDRVDKTAVTDQTCRLMVEPTADQTSGLLDVPMDPCFVIGLGKVVLPSRSGGCAFAKANGMSELGS